MKTTIRMSWPLFHFHRENGSENPWDRETIWTFEGDLDLGRWGFGIGVCFTDNFYTYIAIGPIDIRYYHK